MRDNTVESLKPEETILLNSLCGGDVRNKILSDVLLEALAAGCA